MSRTLRQFRRNMVIWYLMFLGTLFGLSAYTAWRMSIDARGAARDLAVLYADSFGQFIDNSLQASDWVLASVSTNAEDALDSSKLDPLYQLSLTRAPFIRSLSVLDASGTIIASSNQANLGVVVNTQTFVPPASGDVNILRIGEPWQGRDFFNGRPLLGGAPLDVRQPWLIPMTRTIRLGEQALTLLVAFNPDYFIAQFAQRLEAIGANLVWYRLDGVVLLDSGNLARAGSRTDEKVLHSPEEAYARQMWSPWAMAVSMEYPSSVRVDLNADRVWRGWWSEIRSLLALAGLTALLVFLLLFNFYRRQRQVIQQRLDDLQAQRIQASVFNASNEAIVVTDARRHIIAVNPAFTRISGYVLEDVQGRHPLLLVKKPLPEGIDRVVEKALAQQGFWRGEYPAVRKDSSEYEALITITAVRGASGEVERYVGDIADVSAVRAAERRLHVAASVFTYSREGILITDAKGDIEDVNEAFSLITGYSREEVLGKNPRLLQSGRQGPDFYAAMWRALKQDGYWSGEVWNRRKSGEAYAEMLTISAIHDDEGRVQRYLALFSDITALKEHEIRLQRVAYYDSLTNLPNRVLLADRLRQAMRLARYSGQWLAVVYIDLDGFKAINDEHGHVAGDQFLAIVSEHMQGALRSQDTLARVGGDEFVAVIVDVVDVEQLAPILQRLLDAAAQPVTISAVELAVTASLGITVYPQHEDVDGDTLLRQADHAMYQAKQGGKNAWLFFDLEQDRRVRGTQQSRERLQAALHKNELRLYYQPKVNMRTGELVGVEALIRWQHPEQGLLLPAAFLAMADNSELELDIGRWVICNALQQMQAWHRAGNPIAVSVNISARQLMRASFVDDLTAVMAHYPDLPRDMLEIEILESSALIGLRSAGEVIESCRALGVKFAIDDFGTGYSSMTYLKALPSASVKIDSGFTRDMLNDPDDLAIIDSVINLGASFRRQVVAEGVESIAHGEQLLLLGCELGQGFAIAPPMPAQDIPSWQATWTLNPMWASRRALPREQMGVLFAEVEHRAWVNQVENFVRGEQSGAPELDPHACRFGRWLDQAGSEQLVLFNSGDVLTAMHQVLHELAHELLELTRSGKAIEAELRLSELRSLSSAIHEQLRWMLSHA